MGGDQMDVRRRSVLAAGAAGAAVALGGAGTASAAAPGARHDHRDPDSLRALAEKTGLRIGTATSPQALAIPARAAIVAGQFSLVTPGNEMKWQVVEPTQGAFDWSGADQLVAFAKANDQLIRGHTLVWHNQLPAWLTTGAGNGTISDSQLRDLLHQHITTEVSRFRGKIWHWDVCNEFLTDSNPSMIDPNRFWAARLGDGVIADAFRWAHEADPGALLFYNDYNIGGEDGSNAKADAALALVRGLLDQGVPVHGVGIQGHLDTQFGWSPQRLQADIERYASLGLKVAITEADVRTFVNNATDQVPTSNLELFAQPHEFSEMLKAALAVPECVSFTVWGFTDADSWVPGVFTGEGYATPYDVNLNPKPAYFAMQSDLRLAASGAPKRVHTPTPHP
jgi:endo-1,4-beta-xylanase